MDAFVWDQRFVTGLEEVDKQHHRLVEIVNEVGDMLMSSTAATEGKLQTLFKQLADYAHYHFADEEKLMKDFGLDHRHADAHILHHRQFIEQVVSMWRSRASMVNPAEVVHGFLASWLTFHILGEDQAMARQVALVRAGESPQHAFEVEHQPVDNSSSALLSALHNLYGVLSLQNRDLADANLRLEEKVEARTHELQEANLRLEQEQKELSILLTKVEEAQNQLLQSEKMAAIGQLAAGVAHEINNPIGFVNSNIGTLKGYVGKLLALVDAYERCVKEPPPEAAAARRDADLDYLRQDIGDLLRESEEGLSRVKKIVQDLKEFSHVDEAEWQESDLNEGMESTLNVVWNELRYKAEVKREYGSLPPVRCLAAQVNQVFMNLLVNAAQAIEEHGTITVRSGAEGDWAWMEVADSGRGMTPEVQRRIFEPFYTTKPVGKGTGLGLSLSYDIVVKKHGGRFDVTSAPGAGTTFRVWLPLAGEEGKAA
ncbi:MAG TPA: ATP-binding protein [Rhodocyclaceae bacterium]|nr:ATP-binding protein [Rhodocyclaceae bacterium]